MKTRYPLRRLLLTADTVGGVWNYALELAGAFGRGGTEVLLASSGAEPGAAQRRAAECLPNVTWAHRTGDLEWMEEPWTDVDSTGQWLLALAHRFEPDLVHLNDYSHAPLPWGVPTLLVAHSCVLTWWRAVKGERAPDKYREYAERVAQGLEAATMVAAPTAAMLHSLQEEHGDLPFTRVIPNGRTFHAQNADDKLPVIFSAGRLWDEAKNIQLLNGIAPDLTWPIYVAGDVGARETFAHLQHLGQLSEARLAHFLGRTSIYAAPALYEPFGLAILEAALSGCALVLADIPSLREIWADAALYVDPRKPHAWKRVLNEISDDADRRERLGALAYLRAAHLSTGRMVAGYAGAYDELLSGEVRAESAAIARASR